MQDNAAKSFDSDNRCNGESFLNLFFQFNRRLLALLDYFKSPLTTDESHCISELLDPHIVIAKDLTEKLNCDKSTLSRTIAVLKKSRLVTHTKSPHDKREKILSITSKGIDFLKEDVQCRNKEVLSCTYALNEFKRAQCTSYLEMMADTLNAPRPVPVADMEPFLGVIRRLTRAMGILGESVFGTGYPVNTAQVLWLAYKAGGIIPVSELAFSLPYLTSEVSQLLTKLIAGGLILRKANPTDKRRIFICLTKKGSEIVEIIRKRGSAYFEVLVQEWLDDDLARFQELLEESLACPLPSELLPQRSEWDTIRIETEPERSKARAFLIEQYYRNNLHYFVSHTLASPSNITVTHQVKGEIIALVEFERLDPRNKLFKIINFVHTSSLPSRIVLSELVWNQLLKFSKESVVHFSPVVSHQLSLTSLSVHDLQILLNR